MDYHCLMSERDNLPGLEQATKVLQKILYDFAPQHVAEEASPSSGKINKKYELNRQDIPIPQLTRFALELIGCSTFGPGEKLAWGVSFSKGEARCTLTLENLGPGFMSVCRMDLPMQPTWKP
jgi:hypothetical protein